MAEACVRLCAFQAGDARILSHNGGSGTVFLPLTPSGSGDVTGEGVQPATQTLEHGELHGELDYKLSGGEASRPVFHRWQVTKEILRYFTSVDFLGVCT